MEEFVAALAIEAQHILVESPERLAVGYSEQRAADLLTVLIHPCLNVHTHSTEFPNHMMR